MWDHGENETDGKITCKIMNELISPFLPISVNGMTALVKQDKEKANNIANESWIILFAELTTLSFDTF